MDSLQGTQPSHRWSWVTMVTSSSYVPGALALFHSMRRVQSKFALLVMLTASVDEAAIAVLEAEAQQSPYFICRKVDAYRPERLKDAEIVRFQWNWTKLRIFSLFEYDRLIYLDADIVQLRNMDHLFEIVLPERWSWASTYDCKCNLTNDSTECSMSQIPGETLHINQVLGPQQSCYELEESVQSDLTSRIGVNAGVMVVQPDASLWEAMTSYLSSPHNLEKLNTYRFADQDFMLDFLGSKLVPLRWQYNAIKPLAYWHPDIWDEDQIYAIHYVIDKPWNARIASDGLAGQKGRDGPTHKIWWAIWNDYLKCSQNNHKLHQVLQSIDPPLVAPELDEAADDHQRQQNKLSGFPIPVNDKRWPGLPRVDSKFTLDREL